MTKQDIATYIKTAMKQCRPNYWNDDIQPSLRSKLDGDKLEIHLNALLMILDMEVKNDSTRT